MPKVTKRWIVDTKLWKLSKERVAHIGMAGQHIHNGLSFMPRCVAVRRLVEDCVNLLYEKIRFSLRKVPLLPANRKTRGSVSYPSAQLSKRLKGCFKFQKVLSNQ